MKRSDPKFIAYALIDNAGRLAMFGGEVPIFWLRKVANEEAQRRNENGFNIHVEQIVIHRATIAKAEGRP
jgi:hypothetical protein